MRTGKGRLLRLGIDDSLDLAAGFPATHAELFKYRAIVLGSIEASFFSDHQLKSMVDFVKHGGGFLMLGGRKSFAEGGYAETVLAEMLPVELPQANPRSWYRQVKVDVTPTGARYPAIQIAASDSESVKRWKQMPEVTGMNRITRAKPGADVLLVGTGVDPVSGNRDQLVVLAARRYGRGTGWALTIQDSWLWRMQHLVLQA